MLLFLEGRFAARSAHYGATITQTQPTSDMSKRHAKEALRLGFGEKIACVLQGSCERR